MLHGLDLESYRFVPKFLGKCLEKLEESPLTVAEFLAKLASYREMKSTMVPRLLWDVRQQVVRDKWAELDAISDKSVLIEGIFEFLKPFSKANALPSARSALFMPDCSVEGGSKPLD